MAFITDIKNRKNGKSSSSDKNKFTDKGVLIRDHNNPNPSPYIVGFPAFAPAFHEYPEIMPIKAFENNVPATTIFIINTVRDSSLVNFTSLPKILGIR